jgi:hypothetical protein
MNNFYTAIVSLMGLTVNSNGPAGVVFLLCKMGEANASSGTFTGSPFAALKAAIAASAGQSYGYHNEGVEQLLTSADLKFSSR